MTERLAKKDSNGRVSLLVDGYYTRTEDRNLLKYAKKLAYYEDLEEQGRLLVLPAGFNLEKFRLAVASLFCPSALGVDDVGCPAGDSVKRSDCLKCWEKVLKGGAE